jgi:hypothetical protein
MYRLSQEEIITVAKKKKCVDNLSINQRKKEQDYRSKNPQFDTHNYVGYPDGYLVIENKRFFNP